MDLGPWATSSQGGSGLSQAVEPRPLESVHPPTPVWLHDKARSHRSRTPAHRTSWRKKIPGARPALPPQTRSKRASSLGNRSRRLGQPSLAGSRVALAGRQEGASTWPGCEEAASTAAFPSRGKAGQRARGPQAAWKGQKGGGRREEELVT